MQLVDKFFPSNQEWAKILREASEIKVENTTDATLLLDYLRTIVTQPEMPELGNFARIMSLHKSKGLTSRVVIVAGCIQGIIPKINEEDSFSEQEETTKEQRRLFYVAITRAKEILVLSSVSKIDRALAHRIGARVVPGSSRYANAITSNFISELGSAAPRPKLGTTWQSNNFS